MTEEKKPEILEAEDAVRDMKNWIFTFAKEYNLAEDAIKDLNDATDKVAAKISEIACKPEAEIQESEDAVRDLKNWIEVHGGNLADEAKDMLNTKIEELAKKIGAISCK